MNALAVRLVTTDDSQSIWRIRNHSLVRLNSRTSERISFTKHSAWFVAQYGSGGAHRCYVLESDSGVIGYCRFDVSPDDRYLVSVALDPMHHGKGYGSYLLGEALKSCGAGKAIRAEIKKDNEISIRLFKKHSFQEYQEDEFYTYLEFTPWDMNNKNRFTFKNRRILIFQQRGWGLRIGHYLAQRLQAEGVRLAALTYKKSTHAFVMSQKDVRYELIVSADEARDDPVKYLGNSNYTIEEICTSLRIDTIWPLVMTLRNHTRSYGEKFYYSYRQNVSDEVIEAYVKAIYKYIIHIFERFNPEIIIAPNFGSLLHLMFNLFARARGATMIVTNDPRIKGLNTFTYDYTESTGPFCERVDELNSGGVVSNNINRAREYIATFRRDFIKPVYTTVFDKRRTLLQLARHHLSPYYHILQWYLKPNINYVPLLGVTTDHRSPRIILRDFYSSKRYIRFMNKFKYFPFDQIGKFVYFPLQYQPEAMIDVLAPYWSNQIETARQIAMCLPPEYVLVVKEHPAMVGFRPPSYIEKVARTVNVKLVDYRISSAEVLTRAHLVVSPNGTTLVEAAMYHKPCIQLGDLGMTLRLPNVFRHTDITTMTKKIRELADLNLHTPDYERRLEHYVAAAFDTGYAFNYWGVWERAEKDNMGVLWEAYRRELKKVLSVE